VAEGNGRPSRIGRLVWVGWLAVLTVLGVGGYAGATRPVRQPARIISISVYDAGTPPPRAYLTPGPGLRAD